MHPSEEARLLAALDHERRLREMLQTKLAAAEQTHQQLALARLETEREHQASARNAKICMALQERLLELEAELRQTEQQRASEADAAVDRLAQRHAEFTASLAHAARSRDMLAQQLSVAKAALEETRQARKADGIAAADHLRKRQADFEVALAAAAAARAAAEQQVERLQASLQQAAARHESERAAEAERRAARDAEVAASLAQIADERDALQRQLSATSAALEESREERALEGEAARATLEQTVAQAERAQREAEICHELELAIAAAHQDALHSQFEEAVVQAAAARDAYERQLSDAAAALEQAQEHRAADAAAAEQQVERLRASLQLAAARHESERAAEAERRTARDAEVAASLAQIAAERDALRLQLNAASAALDESRTERALDQAAVARLTRREADLLEQVAREADARATLEQTVAQAERTQRQADERHAQELATAAAHQHAVQSQFAEAVAQAAAAREAYERQLSDAAAALEQAQEHRAADAVAAEQHVESLRTALQQAEARHASERSADAERRAAHDAEIAASLAQIADERDALARQLSAVSAALEESRGQREREQRDARATLEQTVAQAERAAREAEERHAQALAAAAAHRDDLQKQVEDALAQAAATRDAFERQLSDAAAALEQAQEQRAADAVAAADRLAEREAELGTLLAEDATIRSALEARLDAVQLALRRAEQDAEAERASASAREQSMLDDLARETDARTGVERELGEARTESARVRRRLLAAASALRRRTHEHRARLEAEFAAERAGQERRLAAREEILRDVEVQRDTLLESLELTRGELQELHDRHVREREEFERVHSSRNSELQRLSAEYDQARQSLDHLRDAFNTLEGVSSEHALERARLEGVVADREAQMSAQEAAHLAAQQAAQEALRQVEQTLRETVEARNHSIGRLERELQTVRQELERARAEGEALHKHAEQVPVLQQRLDASQQENRRQFEHAPHALYRVTRDGAIVAANRALAKILGCRTTDDLAKLDFTAAAFEAPADLSWLIDRAVSGRSPDSVETVWKKKDGTRLNIRLQVLRTTEDWIEVAAEDITELRTTEANLRQARHMEAVGRVASEVAVTCDTLLRGISRGGQYWLAAISSDLGLRHQGEQILGDVAQATSLLQRLAAYGNEQSDALEPVHLQRVMRNLEPVLKRVVGDDIEVVLPKNIPPFSVDVERQRVERVLVTVASYARERMPHGGRLKIDLAATVVDRTFLDRYPSVRPGPHVIATITEERGTTPVVPVSWPAGSADESTTTAGDKPGVDLSALVRLLGDCGGHLWVTAEPPGNMTLKIHLPLRPSDDATRPARSLARSGGGRSLGRWFRH